MKKLDALDILLVVGLCVLGLGTGIAFGPGEGLMMVGGVVTIIGVLALLRKGA